jgi:CubicO group peptidase (beta-lactamase class C family)
MPPQLNQSEKTVAYSNYNAALAAYLIERASGLQFESYLKDHVFKPLQMIRSTAVQPLPEAFLPQASKGYIRSDLSPTGISMASETVYEVGAAKVRASGSDMGLLMLALLAPDHKIISSASLKMMMAEQVRTPHGFMGLGLYSPLSDGGNAFIGHDGGTGGFRNTLALLPERRFGLFVSYNSIGLPLPTSPQDELLRQIAKQYFPDVTIGSHRIRSDVSGVYQPTRRVESNLFKLYSLLQQVYVRHAPGGKLMFHRPAFVPSGFLLTETEPGLYRDEFSGSGLEVSFDRLQDSTTMQVGGAYNIFIQVPRRIGATKTHGGSWLLP